MNFKDLKTFIVIGAHCDDVEGRSGGLFARLTRQGARGVYVVMVENPYVGKGYQVPDAATALAIRRAESRRGAEMLGAARVEFFAFKSYYLHTPDRRQVFPAFRSRAETEAMAAEVSWYGLPPVQNAYLFPECVARLTTLIAEEKPDLIVTHCPNDRHPDHYAVGRFVDLVVNDLNAAGARLTLLLREPGGGGPMGGWRPNVLVELSEQDIETHQRAIDCFPSQHPNGMAGFARAQAVRFGRLGGVPFAEGYARGGGAWGGAWATEEGFREGFALATAPLEIIRLAESGNDNEQPTGSAKEKAR